MLGLHIPEKATLTGLAGNLTVVVVVKHPNDGKLYETIHAIKSWVRLF